MEIKEVTIENLHTASKQNVFNYIANHLLTQKQRSQTSEIISSVCLYKDDFHDRTCAGGCLMPNELYNPKFEGNTWDELVKAKMIPNYHKFLIMALQNIHDRIEPIEWKFHLENLAKTNNLQWIF